MADQLSSDLASLRIERDTPRASRGGVLRSIAIVVVVLGAGAAGIAAGYPYFEAKVFKANVEVTEIAVVSPAQASVELTSTGYVVPQRVSKVGSKVAGRIAKVMIKEGDTVEAGQIIAELEDSDQKAALQTAKSRVATARARAQTARANVSEVEGQVTRERRLADAGVAPKATAEDLEARAKALREQVKAADAEVKAAQAEVNALEVNLEYTIVTAPISGTVIGKPVEAGELVGGLQPGSIAELADFTSLLVETDVPEGRLHMVKPDAPCEIVLDAFPGKRHRGKVVEVSPRVNRAKATVTVKVAFTDAMDGVLPDMAARVSFLTEELDAKEMEAPPKHVVPAGAVADRGGTKVVFVLDGDKVRMKPVTLGPTFGNGFELVEGPPPGTKVIKDPAPTLEDGQKVKQETEQ